MIDNLFGVITRYPSKSSAQATLTSEQGEIRW
jgi:hypothetical protein